MSRIRHFLNTVAVAAIVLAWSALPAAAASLCGDVNTSGTVTSSDALQVLRKAVGQPLQLTCPDFINRYGNPADTNLSSEFSKDFLLGMPVTIEYPASVTHLGLISRDAGSHVKMALYTDDGGSPGELLVGTSSTELVVGSQEISVASTPVQPGIYWIMGIYDVNTFVATDEQAPLGNPVHYRSLPFGDELADPFGPSISYDETRINYWVKVEQ